MTQTDKPCIPMAAKIGTIFNLNIITINIPPVCVCRDVPIRIVKPAGIDFFDQFRSAETIITVQHNLFS